MNDKIKVLIVDDEIDLRDTLASAFERSGYNVLTEQSGNGAFKLLQKDSVDVLISDIRMANGTGEELLVQLQEEKINIPLIIMVTGYADLTDQKAIDLGASCILTKPFRTEKLLEMVTKYFQNEGED